MEAALVVQLLNMMQAGLSWLANRGIARDRALSLLETAQAEGRDVTTAEVQAELDLTQSELDETQGQIDNMPED